MGITFIRLLWQLDTVRILHRMGTYSFLELKLSPYFGYWGKHLESRLRFFQFWNTAAQLSLSLSWGIDIEAWCPGNSIHGAHCSWWIPWSLIWRHDKLAELMITTTAKISFAIKWHLVICRESSRRIGNVAYVRWGDNKHMQSQLIHTYLGPDASGEK